MFEAYQIYEHKQSRGRQIINILLPLATGLLTLIFPNFLYLIAGGYLVALGVLFITNNYPSVVSALPIVAGIIIFIFPELIPITFAVFLGVFGFFMLFLFHLSVMGIITLIIAALIIANPDSVAYLIAFFLIAYAITNIIRIYNNWRNFDETQDRDEVIIE
ncbi:MAG: hypothetical protein WD016_01735 [Balneolaceae bacterium]